MVNLASLWVKFGIVPPGDPFSTRYKDLLFLDLVGDDISSVYSDMDDGHSPCEISESQGRIEKPKEQRESIRPSDFSFIVLPPFSSLDPPDSNFASPHSGL